MRYTTGKHPTKASGTHTLRREGYKSFLVSVSFPVILVLIPPMFTYRLCMFIADYKGLYI